MYQPYKSPFTTPEQVTFPVTRAGLIAWLQTQDPSKRYDYIDPRDCVLSRFQRACGRQYGLWKMLRHPLWEYEIGRPHPWTYGAALQRAKGE